MKGNNLRTVELDPLTVAIELEVPAREVVLLQSYFELYEGLGMVRTVSARSPEQHAPSGADRDRPTNSGHSKERNGGPGTVQMVQILTTKDQLADALSALTSISQSAQGRTARGEK